MSTISVTIKKYDPSTDDAPYDVTYDVPWKEYLTPLEAIHYINENCEPIVFDYSCHGGLCGRCAVMVDGTAKLACFSALDESDHTIEPLAGYPVVRDLTVDRGDFKEGIEDLNLAVQTTKGTKMDDLPAIDYDFWYNDLNHLQMCRECGNCMTVCPIYAADHTAFAGPAPLSQIGMRMFDELDQTDRELQAYTKGIMACIQCHACEAVCPARIPHADLHAMMQQAVVEKGYAEA